MTSRPVLSSSSDYILNYSLVSVFKKSTDKCCCSSHSFSNGWNVLCLCHNKITVNLNIVLEKIYAYFLTFLH